MKLASLLALLLAVVQTPQFGKPAFEPPSNWIMPSDMTLYNVPKGYPIARLWLDGASSVVWLVKPSGAQTPLTTSSVRALFLHQAAQGRFQYGELSVTQAGGCHGGIWLRYDEFTYNTLEEVLYLQQGARLAEIRYTRPVGVSSDDELIARMLRYCNALMR